MDHPLLAREAAIRPWRTAAAVAAAVALLELLLLLAIGGGALVDSLAGRIQLAARETVAGTPAPRAEKAPTAARPAKPVVATRPRAKTVVLVLNGNGRTGAASAAAERVRARGYRIGGVGNASRTDYARSLVMYRPGFAGEGERLARDLAVKAVGPLDGMRPSALGRAHVVLILGR
ncbi:MAG: hypothetical protein KatS3mg012_2276 [Gaiellaceae bacterium]|nr:MAG: hypothetical protein KatS3mg012_2276 [Gaiellaceae bacterium]